MIKEEALNILIKESGANTNEISDGYHTFKELYDSRIALFICLASMCKKKGMLVWRSRVHADGTSFPGWFLLGISREPGEQITYHLPDELWDKCNFAYDLPKSVHFDGHTTGDVITRLLKLANA